jgi:putative transposase
LAKRLVERALQAELSERLGYGPRREPPGGVGNRRNGSTAKTLQTEQGPVEIGTPRDRKGSFEPQLIRKGQRRFEGAGPRSDRPGHRRGDRGRQGVAAAPAR